MISHANPAVNRPAGTFGNAHRVKQRRGQTSTGRKVRPCLVGFRLARVFFAAPVRDREEVGYIRLLRGGCIAFTPLPPATLPAGVPFEVYSPERWRKYQRLRHLPDSVVYPLRERQRAA